jgi:hypothetical protein
MRSVFTAPDGQPHFGAGTFRTTHRSPFSERWGGWYVTGTHGRQRHLGNVLVADEERPESLDKERGANVTDLTGWLDTGPYLTEHSDIVALMVLGHQADMHNQITRANYDARRALRDGRIMNQLLEQPEDDVSESTRRRINNAAERLLKCLLLTDAAELTEKVQGTTRFADRFTELGPRDERGRSLREFDLQHRLFHYPCSYLIYSDAFNALPDLVKQRLYERLWEVLNHSDPNDYFPHLSTQDRRAIKEILISTKPELTTYWRN